MNDEYEARKTKYEQKSAEYESNRSTLEQVKFIEIQKSFVLSINEISGSKSSIN